MTLSPDPVVHYVRDSSGGPDYPRLCRNAVVAGGERVPGQLDLAVIDPEGIRHKRGVEYDAGTPDPPGNTWHHIADCPRLAREDPGAGDDPPAPARRAILRRLYRDGPLHARDIASYTRLSRETVLRALSGMEGDGLAQRWNPGAGRVLWELTGPGTQQAAQAALRESRTSPPRGQQEARAEPVTDPDAPLYYLVAHVPPGREAAAGRALREAGFPVYRGWYPDASQEGTGS